MTSRDTKQTFETGAKCNICNKPFPRETRQLGCLHHFCLDCLQGLETGSIGQKHVRCPTCRYLTLLPTGHEVKHLSKPVTVQSYQDSVDELVKRPTGDRGSLNCDLCDPVKADSTIYCLRCQKKLCLACYKAHQKEKTLNNHDTLPIAETVFCKVHDHQLITLYCADCQSGLCLKCVLQGHEKSHKKHNLQEKVKQNREEIKDILSKQETKYSRIKELRDKTTEINKTNGSDKVYEALRSQLDTFKDAVISDVEKFVKKANEDISASKEEFRKNGDCLERVFESQTKLREHVEHLLNNCSVIDIATQAGQVSKLLNTAAEIPHQLYYPACDDKIRQLSQHIAEQLDKFDLTYKEVWPYGGTDGANKVFRSPEKFTPTKIKQGIVGEASYPLSHKTAAKPMALCKDATLPIGAEVTGLTFDVLSQTLYVKTVDKKRTIQVYSLQWGLLSIWGGNIGGLAEGGKLSLDTKRGQLLATNSDELLVLNKTGQLVSGISNKDLGSTSTFSRGFKLKSASGICYCAMDDKYIISDTSANCVAIIDPETRKVVRKFGSKGSGESNFNGPMFIAYNGCGIIPGLVVSDHNNHCLKVFTTQGQLIQQYGGKGTGQGQLHNPCGVCTDSKGRILVCDWGNQRVVRFATTEGVTTSECLLSAEQLGGANPRDISLHPVRGILAVCVALKNGDYNVNLYTGYA